MQLITQPEIGRPEVNTESARHGEPSTSLQAALPHWPEYLIEGACLGMFMVSACTVTVLLQHPGSLLHSLIPSPLARRALTGVAMGLTAIALIYSPWGKRSGAHLNPSVTFTYFWLGKVAPWDASFYVLAQFAGAVLGVLTSFLLWGRLLSDMSVRYAATKPGDYGPAVAFVAELTISFLMMTVVLNVSNRAALSRFTGLIAGALVATYITVEAPFSGMSMSPARTFGSAIFAGAWTGLWIYFTAPPLGMFLAAQLYTFTRGNRAVFCAKLHHGNDKRCIFRCNYKALNTKLNLKEITL